MVQNKMHRIFSPVRKFSIKEILIRLAIFPEASSAVQFI